MSSHRPLRDATDEWAASEGHEEAGRACTALIAVRDGEQYVQEHCVSLVTIRDSRLRAEWEALKMRCRSPSRFPSGVPRTSPYCAALQEDDPQAVPNEVLGVRTVTDPTSPVCGQKEAYFRRSCAKGTMIPWVGELLLSTETNGYEIELPLGDNVCAVIQPDLRCAAPYVNDFAGEDRSDSNKQHKRPLLNLKIVVAPDVWQRPYLFLQTTKRVDEGATAWMDYGTATPHHREK